MSFFNQFIKMLIDEGNIVDIATNESDGKVSDCYREWGCKVYNIDTSRSPLDMGNIKAIRQIKQIANKNYYDIVHCHTPLAAMCTRLACRKLRKKGTKVYYTAHGFHFYKGASKKNWLIFYPIEKICSFFTDVLITINREDYELALKKMKAKKIVYVPGVGIDLQRYSKNRIDKIINRHKLGIPENAILLISVGELNENKNHETVIRAIEGMENVYYIIAGKGKLKEYLQKIIDDLRMCDRVKLLGYRDDVSDLYTISDVFVFPSFREGLSVSVMEAMASGLPVVCSRIRGNVDLIDENGGELFNPFKTEDCKAAISNLVNRDFEKLGKYNLKKIEKFDIHNVIKKMKVLYEEAGK